MTFVINVATLPGGHHQASRVLADLLGLPQKHEDQHAYALAVVDMAAGAAIELTQFEAPCPENFRAHLVRLLEVLRETADEIEAGHADVLAADTRTCAHPGDQEHDHAMCQEVLGEEWADEQPADVPHEVLVDLLGLVGVHRSADEVAEWSKDQRRQAEHWASATHLSASDNDVQVPARPDFLTEEG